MSLLSLYNRHDGRTVWVCGTGPSLDAINPAEIEGPRVFLNRAAFGLPASGGETYWLVADDAWAQGTPGPWEGHLEAVREGLAGTVGVFRDPLLVPSGPSPTKTGPNIVHWRSYKPRGSVFAMTREQCARGGYLYQHCGTAAPAIFLAWLMGARRVVLVGCDGTDGYAKRLRQFYDKPAKGGLGYMTARGDAMFVAERLGMEIVDRSIGGKHAHVQ